MPPYLFWLGVRLFRKQMPRRRVQVACASIFSLACASGLAAMGGSGDKLPTPCSDIRCQKKDSDLEVLLAASLPLFFCSPMLARSEPFFSCSDSSEARSSSLPTICHVLSNGCVSGSVHFCELRESREERRRLKAERAEEKRLAKEEAALAMEAVRAARRAEKSEAKSKPRRLVVTNSGQESGNEDLDGRKPSLLSSALSMGSAPKGKAASKPRKKLGPAVIEEALVEEESFDAPEPLDVPAKPKLDPSVIKIVSGEKTEKAVDSIPERRGGYVFPPLELLAEAPDGTDFSNEDHAGTMEALVRTLDEFGVKVIPGEIHTGPVITRYEVTPAPGVRVEKIVNLDKNIALGLRAMSVRILAPVPGKGTVGIEVPNQSPQAVCMRDIVESKSWAEAKAEIPVVLGKDVRVSRSLRTDKDAARVDRRFYRLR